MERTADDAAPRSDVAAGLEEREARRVLLVRAFEEADAGALVLSERERERAAARARADGADAAREPGAFLARRAAELGALLTERVPQAERLASGLGFDPGPALVVAPAFVAGLATNALGPEQHVSVLAFPMLGLIAWNLAVYAALALSALRRGASDGVARSP